jgi:hypothetical protein
MIKYRNELKINELKMYLNCFSYVPTDNFRFQIDITFLRFNYFFRACLVHLSKTTMCWLCAKGAKTILVLRKNQLYLINFLNSLLLFNTKMVLAPFAHNHTRTMIFLESNSWLYEKCIDLLSYLLNHQKIPQLL